MKIPTVRLSTVGKCIYCGKSEGPLQDEHVVPYGLNGPWVLPQASCQRCARITSAFEMAVLKKSLTVPRVALDMPTRRKKERPTRFLMVIERDGRQETVEVPIGEHLAPMILAVSEPPVYLSGKSYEKGVVIVGSHFVKVGGIRLMDLVAKHGGKSISVSVSWYGDCYEKLLAKIGYGFGVNHVGVDSFEEVYVLPSILGEKNDVGRWVGCAEDERLRDGRSFHRIELYELNRDLLTRIRLFGIYEVPEYLVVVGKMK